MGCLPEPWPAMLNTLDRFCRGMDISGITHAKHNRPRFKPGRREEARRLLLDFFAQNEGRVQGFKGYLLLDSTSDPQEEIVITFWASKEDMDAFYKSEAFGSFAEM